MSKYAHIDFAANELAHLLLKERSMRWHQQVETLEAIVIFHELDIDTCDFDWVLGKAEQRAFEMRPTVKRAGW